MSLQLGNQIPDFTQDSTDGQINFHDFIDGGWSILFCHPKDFSPVCTTEFGQLSKLKSEFDKRGVKCVGLCCDTVENHKLWLHDINETQGVTLNFPLVCDPDGKVASLFGMSCTDPADTICARSVFIIDPNKKLRLTLTYPEPTGFNFSELLRVVDSLQLTDTHKVATPVDWKYGDDVIILPSVSNEDAKTMFPHGWDEQKPYLRVAKQPHKESAVA